MAQGLLRECLHSYRVYFWKQVAWSVAWIVLCLTFKAWVGYVLLPVLIGAQIFAVVSAIIMNAKSGAFQTKSGACPWDPDWEDMTVVQKMGVIADTLFHIGVMGFLVWFILICFLESLKWTLGCY
jgi:hypothetical protein